MNWQRSRDFLRDTSGTVYITVGLMIFSLFGMAGLGIDVGLWYSTSRTVQSAADAAAIGGAYEVLAGGDATAAKIFAAAEAKVKIVLIRRPPPEPGPSAETVDECMAWVESRL